MPTVRSSLVFGLAAAAAIGAYGCDKAELRMDEGDPPEVKRASPDAGLGVTSSSEAHREPTPAQPRTPPASDPRPRRLPGLRQRHRRVRRAVRRRQHRHGAVRSYYRDLADFNWRAPILRPVLSAVRAVFSSWRNPVVCGDGIVDADGGEECDEMRKDGRLCTRSTCNWTSCAGKDLSGFVDDYDCDGVVDRADNCFFRFNPEQADKDKNSAESRTSSSDNGYCIPPHLGRGGRTPVCCSAGGARTCWTTTMTGAITTWTTAPSSPMPTRRTRTAMAAAMPATRALFVPPTARPRPRCGSERREPRPPAGPPRSQWRARAGAHRTGSVDRAGT